MRCVLSENVLPIPLYGSSIACVGRKIYIYGGVTADDKLSDVILTASTDNPLEWAISDTTLPYPLSHAYIVQYSESLSIFGGRTAKGNSRKVIYAHTDYPLDFRTDGREMHVKLRPDPIIIGSYVYLVGGYDKSGLTDKICQAPVREQYMWDYVKGCKLPFPVKDAIVITYNRTIYAYGGCSSEGASNKIMVITGA